VQLGEDYRRDAEGAEEEERLRRLTLVTGNRRTIAIVMDLINRREMHSARDRVRDEELGPDNVKPFGPYGAGFFTAHPIGLIVALALVFVAWRLPEARWFTIYSLPFGAIVGFVLWMRHRGKGFPSPPTLAPKSK
jgi:hypothetical protein